MTLHPFRASPIGRYPAHMDIAAFDQPINLNPVREAEREFFVVWKALDELWKSAPFEDLTRLEAQRAAEALLHLIRQADCIDPSLALDGTGRLQTFPAAD